MKRMAGMQTYMVTKCLARTTFNPSKQRNKGNQAMTIDELLETPEQVLISVKRARHIVTVQHSLTGPNEFEGFMDSHGKDHGGMVCAATLYAWLGY